MESEQGGQALPGYWAGTRGVIFGDSITSQDGRAYAPSHIDSGVLAVGWPTYLREALGSTVENRALSSRTMVELWNGTIKGYDFRGVDFVWFAAGTNDYRKDVTGDEPGVVAAKGSAFATDTFAGALQAAIEKALADNPTIKIFLAAPIPGWFMEGGTKNVPNPDAAGTMLPESFADTVKALGALYGLPVVDWYNRSGLTEANYESLLGDNPLGPYLLHPRDDLQAVMGSMAAAEMLASLTPGGQTHGAPGDVVPVIDGSGKMAGGAGTDVYLVDSALDGIREAPSEGHDTVLAFVSHSLSANVEDLTLLGHVPSRGSGNALDNLIVGNAAANLLKGGGGSDTLYGRLGDDSLDGGDGDDLLVGGMGADWLVGGLGDDVYILDNAADVVREASALGGVDTVYSSAKFSLGKNVEHLTLTGIAAVSGSGNELDNLITGNKMANLLKGGRGSDTLDGGRGDDILNGGDGDDLLIGGAGADWLEGGLGDDVYIVDSMSDLVREASTLGGVDTVYSPVKFSLGKNVENLTLTGSAAVGGSGNELDNVITGNTSDNVLKGGAGADRLLGGAGDDVLDGGSGIDTMNGGLGGDVYYIEDIGDVVNERADEGIDTVHSAFSYALGANFENLTLTGSQNASASGNALANHLTGNAGANTLKGAQGKDLLAGGLGGDTLIGGTGADKFLFDSALGGANFDRIPDFASAEDAIWLDQSIFGALAPGVLPYGAFRVGAVALEADDRILFDSDTGKLRYDADGTGSIAAVTFALLEPGTMLFNHDFFVVP